MQPPKICRTCHLLATGEEGKQRQATAVHQLLKLPALLIASWPLCGKDRNCYRGITAVAEGISLRALEYQHISWNGAHGTSQDSLAFPKGTVCLSHQRLRIPKGWIQVLYFLASSTTLFSTLH